MGIPLYKQIIKDILDKIYDGTLRPGDRIPSERELANTYMVSSITSKSALVELADKGFIVRVKGKGSFVNTLENLMAIPSFSNTRSTRNNFNSKTIGLILPSMKTGIDQQLLNAIEEEISKTDYLLTLIITRESQEKESDAIKNFILQGASGLIIFPTEHELYNESILKLSIDKFPFVLVDRWLRGIRTNSVMINNYAITKQATQYLLNKNATNVAFISPDSKNTVTEDRLAGFTDCLVTNKLALNTYNTCMLQTTIENAEEKIKIIEDFLLTNLNIDGIVCSNKEMATYVSLVLDKHKLWDRFSVCAFDYYSNPKVAFIEQDIKAIATACVELLLETIQGEVNTKQVCIPAKFHKN